MAEQAYWYVVHTYSGYENKVATDLMTMVENRHIQDLICDVKVPTETVLEDQFDKTGNQHNWWTAADKKNFEARTKVLVNHFNTIELAGKKVNGQLTLGENIGDNGGLNIAFRALQNVMKTEKLGVKDGFTPEQRFFLSWARVWAGNARPEYLQYLMTVDVHSPNEARVNGALPMVDAWYKAFGIKKGEKLFVPKNKRAHIW